MDAQARLAAAPGADCPDLPSATRLGAIRAALPLTGGQALRLGGEYGTPKADLISWVTSPCVVEVRTSQHPRSPESPGDTR